MCGLWWANSWSIYPACGSRFRMACSVPKMPRMSAIPWRKLYVFCARWQDLLQTRLCTVSLHNTVQDVQIEKQTTQFFSLHKYSTARIINYFFHIFKKLTVYIILQNTNDNYILSSSMLTYYFWYYFWSMFTH